mmetsp:Transcript_93510/g.286160  ORF Transcript_93510/g.286160 Transcript_93510/m.286160 type:complete len:245 (+) Transcript_93510:1027-1761(+)
MCWSAPHATGSAGAHERRRRPLRSRGRARRSGAVRAGARHARGSGKPRNSERRGPGHEHRRRGAHVRERDQGARRARGGAGHPRAHQDVGDARRLAAAEQPRRGTARRVGFGGRAAGVHGGPPAPGAQRHHRQLRWRAPSHEHCRRQARAGGPRRGHGDLCVREQDTPAHWHGGNSALRTFADELRHHADPPRRPRGGPPELRPGARDPLARWAASYRRGFRVAYEFGRRRAGRRQHRRRRGGL